MTDVYRMFIFIEHSVANFTKFSPVYQQALFRILNSPAPVCIGGLTVIIHMIFRFPNIYVVFRSPILCLLITYGSDFYYPTFCLTKFLQPLNLCYEGAAQLKDILLVLSGYFYSQKYYYLRLLIEEIGYNMILI